MSTQILLSRGPSSEIHCTEFAESRLFLAFAFILFAVAIMASGAWVYFNFDSKFLALSLIALGTGATFLAISLTRKKRYDLYIDPSHASLQLQRYDTQPDPTQRESFDVQGIKSLSLRYVDPEIHPRPRKRPHHRSSLYLNLNSGLAVELFRPGDVPEDECRLIADALTRSLKIPFRDETKPPYTTAHKFTAV